MKINQSWSAKSRTINTEVREELVGLAGRWGVGINVTITKPFQHSHGSFQRNITDDRQVDINEKED